MLSISALESLANCTIKNGVIDLKREFEADEYNQLRSNLRNAILDGKIPFYKPIAVKVCNTQLQRVTNIDKDLNESYLGMIPQLLNTIIMPEEKVETDPGNWAKVDDNANKIFNTSRVIQSRTIPASYLIYGKTIDSGEQYVESIRFMVNKAKYGSNVSKESMKPLIKNLSPIVTVNDDDIKSITLEFVFAQAAGEVNYLDIEKTLGNIKDMYCPVTQYYDLDQYLLVSLLSRDNSSILLGYKQDIDESVLQCILNQFGRRLVDEYNNVKNGEVTNSLHFMSGNIDDMWEGVSKCW